MSITIADLERFRAPLTGHCYRMLGSSADADDAVQEALLRAWRALPQFEGRSSVATWLYRIATHVCLDALAARKKKRMLPLGDGPVGAITDELVAQPREYWIEPIADAHAIPSDADPATQLLLRESLRLAFVAALQELPPKQRAALLLVDVLGFSVAEASETLELSEAAVASALQRATSCRGGRRPSREVDPAVVDRYVDAFERYDVAALQALLRDDVVLSMPPFTLWLSGPEAVGKWLLGRGIGCKGSRLVATRACGMPAFGQYRASEAGFSAWSLIVLDIDGDDGRIAAMTHFLDTEALFPRFGLSSVLAASSSQPLRL